MAKTAMTTRMMMGGRNKGQERGDQKQHRKQQHGLFSEGQDRDRDPGEGEGLPSPAQTYTWFIPVRI